jgi:hypothetical protein
MVFLFQVLRFFAQTSCFNAAFGAMALVYVVVKGVKIL